jgi:hypothetical protein
MRDDGAPVAARTEVDPATIKDAANLHVEVTGATKRFHLWQQGPAWILGFAAIGLGFLMCFGTTTRRRAGSRSRQASSSL